MTTMDTLKIMNNENDYLYSASFYSYYDSLRMVINTYFDLNLILFYTFLIISFSTMLTFEKSRRYLQKRIKFSKLNTITRRAASVIISSTAKNVSRTATTTIKVKRFGGNIARKFIIPLKSLKNYRKYIYKTKTITSKINTSNSINGNINYNSNTVQNEHNHHYQHYYHYFHYLHHQNKLMRKFKTSHKIYNSQVHYTYLFFS